MKKRLIAIMLCVATAITMVGCGDKGNQAASTEITETTEEGVVKEESKPHVSSTSIKIDPSGSVTSLCEYKGIPITITGNYEVTEEAVNSQIETVLNNFNLLYAEVTDRTTVEAGDFVEIDYVGKDESGTAFEGGTSTSSVIMDIDNNYCVSTQSGFIDGFCDKLVGAKVGSMVETPVTFPEQYHSADLAGKPATFEITVKSIRRKLAIDDITDEMIESNFKDYGFETKDAFVENMRDYIKSSKENSRNNDAIEACEQYFLENCTVEVPEDYLQARLDEYTDNFKKQYLKDGQELDEYFQSYGYTTEQITGQWKTSLTDQIKLEFIFLSIAEKEAIEMDEEGFKTFIQTYIDSESYQCETEDDVYEFFGAGSKDGGKTYMENLYLIRKAILLVKDNAVITEQSEAALDAAATETVETTEQ